MTHHDLKKQLDSMSDEEALRLRKGLLKQLQQEGQLLEFVLAISDADPKEFLMNATSTRQLIVSLTVVEI